MTSGRWAGSDRRSELPPDWPQRRQAELDAAGGRCRKVIKRPDGSFRRCPAPATDVDHKVPGNDHSPGNLQALCASHHRIKSANEGVAARQKPTSTRPRERHPGERRR